jgi:hypothetical protein
MKSFAAFQSDATWAMDNLIAEAKGFKDQVKRRRKKRKEFLSAREKKIQKLRNRPSHWSGLE